MRKDASRTPGGSPPALLGAEPHAFSRLGPGNQVLARLNAAGPVDQLPDHVRFGQLPAASELRQTGRALPIEFHGKRGHGNTAILRWHEHVARQATDYLSGS